MAVSRLGRRQLAVGAGAGCAVAVVDGPLAQPQAPVPALRGAGATFPAPLYYKWLEMFAKERPGARISYDSVGSGDGIVRFLAGAVDFGATDSLPPEKDLAQVARGALVVPATAGMISIAYNLPGAGRALRLSRDAYVDIFAGRITHWDDPRLRADNPELRLPHRNIALVARLDRSGTTAAFTGHLGAVSQSWRVKPGVGSLVEWPSSSMLARGNEGVASRIKISEGSIGYVEYGFAKRLGLSLAVLQNKAGQFVAPEERSAQAALAEAVHGLADGALRPVTDPADAGAYPIVTYSWLLLYRKYPDPGQRKLIVDFIDWSLGSGQSYAASLGFVALPEAVASSARSAVRSIQ